MTTDGRILLDQGAVDAVVERWEPLLAGEPVPVSAGELETALCAAYSAVRERHADIFTVVRLATRPTVLVVEDEQEGSRVAAQINAREEPLMPYFLEPIHAGPWLSAYDQINERLVPSLPQPSRVVGEYALAWNSSLSAHWYGLKFVYYDYLVEAGLIGQADPVLTVAKLTWAFVPFLSTAVVRVHRKN